MRRVALVLGLSVPAVAWPGKGRAQQFAPAAPQPAPQPSAPSGGPILSVPLSPGGAAALGYPPGLNPALQQAQAPSATPQGGPSGAGAPTGGFDVGAGVEMPSAGPAEPVVPQLYTVTRGDTLWDISNNFFQNPWYWPKLWSLNPVITNPHWIFPGQVLRLLPERVPVPVHAEQPPALFTPPPGQPLVITQDAFVEEGRILPSATIIGSAQDNEMLGTGDIAYADTDRRQPLIAGAPPYPVYRLDREVYDPDTHQALGALMIIVGTYSVDLLQGNGIARGLLTSSDAIQRGDKVGPLPHAFQQVGAVPNDVDVPDARVAAILYDLHVAGAGQVVVVNRGSAQGVRVGNRFVVYRQGDQYPARFGETQATEPPPCPNDGPGAAHHDSRRHCHGTLDLDFPKEDRAVLLVLDVQPHTSVAFAIESDAEIVPGDYCEMRKGY